MKKRYELNRFKAFSHPINKKKLYKKGKSWIIGSLTLLALTGLGVTAQRTTRAANNGPQTHTASVGSTADIERKAKVAYNGIIAHSLANPSSAGQPTQNSNPSSKSGGRSSTAGSVVANGLLTQSSSGNRQASASSKPNEAPVSSAVNSAASGPSMTRPHFNSAYQNYVRRMSGTDVRVQNANVAQIARVQSGRNSGVSLSNPTARLGQPLVSASLTNINSADATVSATDKNWIYDSAINKYITSDDLASGNLTDPVPKSSLPSLYSSAIEVGDILSDQTFSDFGSEYEKSAGISLTSEYYAIGSSLAIYYDQHQSFPSQYDNDWLYFNTSDTDASIGEYQGGYRYNPATQAVEFISDGKILSDNKNPWVNFGQIKNPNGSSIFDDAPRYVQYATSVKLAQVIAVNTSLKDLLASDPAVKVIDTSGFKNSDGNISDLAPTNISGMFKNDVNLSTLLISNHINFDASDASYLFANDRSLHYLDLPYEFSFWTMEDDGGPMTPYGERGMFYGTPLTRLTVESPSLFFYPRTYSNVSDQYYDAGLDRYQSDGQPIPHWYPDFYTTIQGQNVNLRDYNGGQSVDLENGQPIFSFLPDSINNNPNLKSVTFTTTPESHQSSQATATIDYTNLENGAEYTDLDGGPTPRINTSKKVHLNGDNEYQLRNSDFDLPEGPQFGWALVQKNRDGTYRILHPGYTISFNRQNQFKVEVLPEFHGLVYKYSRKTNPHTVEFIDGSLTHGSGFMSDEIDSDGGSLRSDGPYAEHPAINHLKFDDQVGVDTAPQRTADFQQRLNFSSDYPLTTVDLGTGFSDMSNIDTQNVFSHDPNLKKIIIRSPEARFDNGNDMDSPGLQGTWKTTDVWSGNQDEALRRPIYANMNLPSGAIYGPHTWVPGSDVTDVINFQIIDHEGQVPAQSTSRHLDPSDRADLKIQGPYDTPITIDNSDLPDPEHYQIIQQDSDGNVYNPVATASGVTFDGIGRQATTLKYDNEPHTILVMPKDVIDRLTLVNYSDGRIVGTQNLSDPYQPHEIIQFGSVEPGVNPDHVAQLPTAYRLISDRSHPYVDIGHHPLVAKVNPVQNTVYYTSDSPAVNIASRRGNLLNTFYHNGDNYIVYVEPAIAGETVDYRVRPNAMNYPDDNNGSVIGSFTAHGASYAAKPGASFTVTSDDGVPSGYQIYPGDQQLTFNYRNDSDNHDQPHVVEIAPKLGSATVQFYNRNAYAKWLRDGHSPDVHFTVSEATFRGNSYAATGAGDNQTVLTPANYRIYRNNANGTRSDVTPFWTWASASPAVDVMYTGDHSTYMLPVVPARAADTIVYRYHGRSMGTQQFFGNDYRAFNHASDSDDDYLELTSANATGMPKNYHLVNPNNYYEFNDKSYDAEIAPDSASATVQYTYDGSAIATDSTDFKGNSVGASGASDTGADINNFADPEIPHGYHLDLVNTNVPYDNATHQVAIVPNLAVIHYTFHGERVGSDVLRTSDVAREYPDGTSDYELTTPFAYTHGLPGPNPETPYAGYYLASPAKISFDDYNPFSHRPRFQIVPVEYRDPAIRSDIEFTGQAAGYASGVNNRMNNRDLAQARSLVTQASNYASSADQDQNSLAIELQSNADRAYYRQIQSLASQASVYNDRAKSAQNVANYYSASTPLNSAWTSFEASKANHDANNAYVLNRSAGSVMSAMSRIVAPQRNKGYVQVDYVDQNTHQPLRRSLVSGWAGNAVPLSTLDRLSMSGYMAKSVSTNGISSFATSSSIPAIDVEMVPDTSDATVKSMVHSMEDSASNVTLRVARADRRVINSLASASASTSVSLSNSARSAISRQSTADHSATTQLVDQLSSYAYQTERSVSGSASTSASAALKSQSNADYGSGADAIETANQVIMSLVNSASAAVTQRSATDDASAKNAIHSLAKYADHVESQAVSQATHNDQNNVASQSANDRSSANVALSNQNRRDVNEAVNNEDYLISLDNHLRASAASTEDQLNSSASSSASAALSNEASSLNNRASSAVKSATASASQSANVRYVNDSNARNAAVSSVASSASSSVNSAMSSAMASAKRNCSSEQASVSTSASAAAQAAISSQAANDRNSASAAMSNNDAKASSMISSANRADRSIASQSASEAAQNHPQPVIPVVPTSQSSAPNSASSVTPLSYSVAPQPSSVVPPLSSSSVLNSATSQPASSTSPSSAVVPSLRSTAGIVKHVKRSSANASPHYMKPAFHRVTHRANTEHLMNQLKKLISSNRHGNAKPSRIRFTFHGRPVAIHQVGNGRTERSVTNRLIKRWLPKGYAISSKTTAQSASLGKSRYGHQELTIPLVRVRNEKPSQTNAVRTVPNNVAGSRVANDRIQVDHRHAKRQLPQTNESRNYSVLFAMLFVISSTVLAYLGRAIDKRHDE